MKFTIRDLLLITALVAVLLGWWIDRSRLAAQSAKNEAIWKALFDDAMANLSASSPQERFYETPAGPVSVNRKPDPENAITMP